jgi:hypothetical protein
MEYHASFARQPFSSTLEKSCSPTALLVLRLVRGAIFSQSLRQTVDLAHCGVEYHASFARQPFSSTLEKSCTPYRTVGASAGIFVSFAALNGGGIAGGGLSVARLFVTAGFTGCVLSEH